MLSEITSANNFFSNNFIDLKNSLCQNVALLFSVPSEQDDKIL